MPVSRRSKSFYVQFIIYLCAFMAAGTIFPPNGSAGDKAVKITPTRVLFEGRTRTASIRLINPNSAEQTYKISLVAIRMDEYGTRKESETPDESEQFARSLIRFSPRRATIAPNGWQTVRLMVRKPKGLPDGEYRTQLKVEPLPGLKKDGRQKDNDGISIKIDIVFHVSIPVIVRHGKTQASIVVHGPKLLTRNNSPVLETRLERQGNASVFGDVTAYITPNTKTGSRIQLGQIKGISIYAQNRYQTLYIPVAHPDLLTPGQLDIEVTSREKKDAPLIGRGRFNVDTHSFLKQ